MPLKIYNKLVRDKIPEICAAENQTPDFHKIASDGEFLASLLQKLKEETEEMTVAPSVEEAADIFEVLLAIGTLEGFTQNDLLRTAENKRDRKGGFAQRLFLHSVKGL